MSQPRMAGRANRAGGGRSARLPNGAEEEREELQIAQRAPDGTRSGGSASAPSRESRVCVPSRRGASVVPYLARTTARGGAQALETPGRLRSAFLPPHIRYAIGRDGSRRIYYHETDG